MLNYRIETDPLTRDSWKDGRQCINAGRDQSLGETHSGRVPSSGDSEIQGKAESHPHPRGREVSEPRSFFNTNTTRGIRAKCPTVWLKSLLFRESGSDKYTGHRGVHLKTFKRSQSTRSCTNERVGRRKEKSRRGCGYF